MHFPKKLLISLQCNIIQVENRENLFHSIYLSRIVFCWTLQDLKKFDRFNFHPLASNKHQRRLHEWKFLFSHKPGFVVKIYWTWRCTECKTFLTDLSPKQNLVIEAHIHQTLNSTGNRFVLSNDLSLQSNRWLITACMVKSDRNISRNAP